MIRTDVDVLLDKVGEPVLQADCRRQIERRQAKRSLGLGDHLADARAELRDLADHAEHHGDEFVRIESVAKAADDSLPLLDLTEFAVRDAVRVFEGGKVTALCESTVAKPYL